MEILSIKIIIKSIRRVSRRLLFINICLLLFAISCHSEYVSLNYSIHHSACWNSDHTKVAFILSKCAYKHATGISKFPDGGIPEYLLRDVSLYIYDVGSNSLYKAIDFNDLTELLGHSRSSWKSKIAYTDSQIYYQVLPLMEWNWYLKNKSVQKNYIDISKLRKKYSGIYIYDEKVKKVKDADSSAFLSFYNKRNETDLTELSNKLSMLPIKELGLDIKVIQPKSDDEYIEETIYLKNTSTLARRAVIEQIISKLSRENIKEILKKMDEYKDSLKGLKRTEYEIYSKDVYQRISALL